jgi:tRNA A-37 threonylcarbamoyl transferase component Bud32
MGDAALEAELSGARASTADEAPTSAPRIAIGPTLHRRRDSTQIGRILRGSYRILRPLEVGGMAIVYEAEHLRLKRLVAIKFLSTELSSDSAMGLRFHREAEVLARLSHPHIVKVLDFDTAESGEPFLVMELLDGETLATRLERDCMLGLAEAVAIATQLASGLAAAHQAQIVHRDLKPANVFLEAVAGEPALVKLLDFGISKTASRSQLLTHEHMVLGTPEYMAPEQASGSASLVDHRADQYSLAAIVYEMLSGRPPFPIGDDIGALLRRVIHERPRPLIELAPSVGSVSNVVMRALSKDPRARFATVGAFAEALRSAGARELGSGKPIGLRVSERAQADSAGASRIAVEVRSAAESARQAFDRGNLVEAALLAEMVVDLAHDALDPRVVPALARQTELLERILIARLGGISRVLRADSRSPSLSRLKLTPEDAFLLSRIDDGLTLEETLDVSAMPRLATLRLLTRLLRSGALMQAE